MADLVVRGASVWRDESWRVGDVVCRDGEIVDGPPGEDAAVVEAAGLLAVPGFVDLQCNGALGIDLASEPERLWELGAALPRWGVTAWLPTIVTAPPEVVGRAQAALGAGPPAGWSGAVPLGLHVEGPFLSPARRGAHPGALLRTPTLDAVEGWSRADGVAMVTLAPELDGAAAVVAALVARGVVVALGHSAATAEQARRAIDAGASSVTHVFNAMAPLHHRAPGLAGVALTDPRVHVGLIADGIHVDPTVVDLTLRAAGPRVVLVTDAVAALGMPPGAQRLGGATVMVGGEGVRLADGTLAGSDLAMDQAVRNLVAFTGCAPEVACAAAAAAPAHLLGDPARGVLSTGARADLVLLSRGLEVVATVIGGAVAHAAPSTPP